MTRQHKAVGYVNRSVEGAGLEACEKQIRCQASELDYHLLAVLSLGPETPDHMGRILTTLRAWDAIAVVTPGLEHVGRCPHPICSFSELVTCDPPQMWRWHSELNDCPKDARAIACPAKRIDLSPPPQNACVPAQEPGMWG